MEVVTDKGPRVWDLCSRCVWDGMMWLANRERERHGVAPLDHPMP